MGVSIEQALRWSGELQRARTLGELVRTIDLAVRTVTRYQTTWIGWFDTPETIRVILATGAAENVVLDTSPVVPRAGDAMLAELEAGKAPVVVVDARSDPRVNPAMVELYGNRTIINIPMQLGGGVVGSLGTGTFAPADVMPPTDEELEALVAFSTQLAPAFERVAAIEEAERSERERLRVSQHLESLQRVELMGVLAAGVAHDLNNLLSVALTGTQTIDQRVLSADDVAALQDTESALFRMRDIAKQLLTLGHVRGGRQQDVDLADRVSSTLALVRRSIAPSVKVELSRVATPIVRGDPVQLEQALANLIINARDAVGTTGRIQLNVDEHIINDASPRRGRVGRAKVGRYGRVCVSDSGPGIPAELQARVFDPLFTTKATGTGLGLAVVSRIIEQHEGFIAIESEPGRGASFELYLPAVVH